MRLAWLFVSFVTLAGCAFEQRFETERRLLRDPDTGRCMMVPEHYESAGWEPCDEGESCVADSECGAGFHCSTSDGDCFPPPGCDAGEVCPAVCGGLCVPDGIPPPCAEDATSPPLHELHGVWTSREGAPARVYTFHSPGTAAGGTFQVDDLVAPCPAGAQCLWSGVITNKGSYARDASGAYRLTYVEPLQTWEGLRFASSVALRGCGDDRILVEGDGGRAFRRVPSGNQ